MEVLTSESLLTDLRRLPLLTAEQMARVESASSRTRIPPPETIIQRLTDRAWITPYQAEVILSGRACGLVLGHYVLLSKVGEGGMGAVFKARHTRLDRIDALKVIRADKITSSVIAKRFLREIQLTADLNHPHIIKALDAGEVGSQLYLATEYVAGEDLATIIRREGSLSVADACLVTYQTALALQHIHEHKLVHRDLKPSNIMREEKTRAVKVLDLGLSNSLQGVDPQAGAITRDGVMLGTPDFMPPEQARNPRGVDIRGDLYSLGCTFFYLLTGRAPYEGSSVEKLMQHASAPIPPLILPHGPAPLPLAAIIVRLLAKSPEERFRTPQELIDALLALRSNQPVPMPSCEAETVHPTASAPGWQSEFDLLISNDPSAPAANATEKPKLPEQRRSGRWWWVAAAVLVAAGAGAILLARGRGSIEEVAAETQAAPEEPVDELKLLRAAVQNPLENREQVRARVLAYHAKNPVAAANLLRKLPSPLDRLAPVKGTLSDSPVVKLSERGASVLSMTFVPTDDKLVVVRDQAPTQEWELPAFRKSERPPAIAVVGDQLVAGGRSVKLERNLKPRLTAILPDSKTAVVSLANSTEPLLRVNLDTGRIVERFEHPSNGITAITTSPDGGTCLVCGPKNMIRLFSTSTGKLIQAFDAPAKVLSNAGGCFGPDGQRLYLIGAFRTAGRFAAGSVSPTVTYEVAPERSDPRYSDQGRPLCIAVSADEFAVAVGTRSGLHLYSAGSGKATQEFRFTSGVSALAFSTNGRVLAVALVDGSVLLLPFKG